MKGHEITLSNSIDLYLDTMFSTCVLDNSTPSTFAMNSILYSDNLEKSGWFGVADTIRVDVKRGEFGGSFEEKSFFRSPRNEEFEIALTSEYNKTNSHGIFLFEAYKVTDTP